MRMKNFDFFAKEFTLKILMLSLCGMLFSCADIGERDNPVDPGYKGVVESKKLGIVDSFDDLPFCDSDNKGEMVYVQESSQTYSCTGGVWKVLNGVEDNTPISYGTLSDSRDGKTYKTVTIGKQTWMAENLNYDYNEGTAKIYCYNNSADSCAKYGRLYLWSAAMDSAAVFSTAGKGCDYGKTCASAGSATLVRGVCPEGWHLPSYDEWNTLFTAVGGTSTAGTKLKSTSGWNGGGNGTDAFGFSGLPAGGYSSYVGGFYDVGSSAYFWSSTEGDSGSAYSMYLAYSSASADLGGTNKIIARSVRCLRD